MHGAAVRSHSYGSAARPGDRRWISRGNSSVRPNIRSRRVRVATRCRGDKSVLGAHPKRDVTVAQARRSGPRFTSAFPAGRSVETFRGFDSCGLHLTETLGQSPCAVARFSRVSTMASPAACAAECPVTADRKSARCNAYRFESTAALTVAVRGTSRKSAISPK
jgi:hypothetical protein